MTITMLPQTACTPSRLGMPAHRYASVSPRAAAVIGADVRDRAGQATAGFAAQGFAVPGTSAWSPPTS